MRVIEKPKLSVGPTPDPYYEAACANVKAAFRDLVERGIVDEQGNRIRQDLPLDMQEGSDRDFGG
jgi:hypothetical protein